MSHDYIAAYEKYGSHRKAAKALGIAKSTFSDRYNKQKANAEHATILQKYKIKFSEPDEVLPDNEFIKKQTIHIDAEGNIKNRWLKTDQEAQDTAELYERLLNKLCGDIERVQPQEYKHIAHSNLCSLYAISDFHLGQLSSEAETGHDWTLEKAHDMLCDWITKARFAAPYAKQAILCDLGDFLHADGLVPETPTSGHALDASSRFRDVVDVAINVFDYAINELLQKHENVHVIICEGNHNIDSSYWQVKAISRRYENEPRVTFDFSKLPYYAYKWGKTGLYFHHGHKKKMSDIAKTFVAQFREIYGTTKYSYGHMGHLHHRDMKECQLMVMEQHSTLAPKDAHSARGGYHSERGASVISYHKNHGEIMRNTLRPEMLL